MIILSIVIVLLLGVVYYLYFKNNALRNAAREHRSEDNNEDGEEVFYYEEPAYSVLANKQITKKEAVQTINAAIGRNELSNANTSFSKLNKAKPVWWYDILPEKFSEDLNLILRKES